MIKSGCVRVGKLDFWVEPNKAQQTAMIKCLSCWNKQENPCLLTPKVFHVFAFEFEGKGKREKTCIFNRLLKFLWPLPDLCWARPILPEADEESSNVLTVSRSSRYAVASQTLTSGYARRTQERVGSGGMSDYPCLTKGMNFFSKALRIVLKCTVFHVYY